MEQIDESIARYLSQLDSADREESAIGQANRTRLEEKIEKLKAEIKRLKGIESDLHRAPDRQTSQTDPDARSMATSGRGSGTVGYNVQIAVEPTHHLIVAEEVTNVGNDREQLATMATKAREAVGSAVWVGKRPKQTKTCATATEVGIRKTSGGWYGVGVNRPLSAAGI